MNTSTGTRNLRVATAQLAGRLFQTDVDVERLGPQVQSGRTEVMEKSANYTEPDCVEANSNQQLICIIKEARL